MESMATACYLLARVGRPSWD